MSLFTHTYHYCYYNYKSGTYNLDYACNEFQSGKNFKNSMRSYTKLCGTLL